MSDDPVLREANSYDSSSQGSGSRDQQLHAVVSRPRSSSPAERSNGLKGGDTRVQGSSCGLLPEPPGRGSNDQVPDFVARRRRDQKKFRVKEKERSHAARCLLEETQERLRQAETHKTRLEARNRILEGLFFAQTKPAAEPSRASAFVVHKDLPSSASQPFPDILKSMLLPDVKLTAATGNTCYLTPYDIAQLPLENFAKLYRDAIHQITAGLKRAAEVAAEPAVVQRLAHEHLVSSTVEALSLILSLVMYSPSRLPQFANLSMADGSVTDQQGPQAASSILACMGLSDGQMQDLLALRHLFFAQVGCLTAERISLMQSMAEHSQQLQKVEAWAERLKQNILEEHQCYLHTITAAYLGIGTAQQAAVGMVAAYPSLLNRNLIEEYAVSKGEQPLPDIINASSPTRNSLTWDHVSLYVQKLHTGNMLTYVPLPSALE